MKFIYKTNYFELPFEKYRVCKIKTFAAIGKIDEDRKGGLNPLMLIFDPGSGAIQKQIHIVSGIVN